MTDQQALQQLLEAETLLKRTKRGYTPAGTWWKQAMPKLWDVRQALGATADGHRLAEAHGILKETEKGYSPSAPRWKEAMGLIDKVEGNLYHGPVPQLGPLYRGDKSLLLYSPTHNTDGIEGDSVYPAFDSGWATGKIILAPENLKVTRQSQAAGADAFYATGTSKLRYWFGHVAAAPATGRTFTKGQELGRIARIAASQGGPHLHLGINAIPLLDHDLKWGRNGNGPDYTYGSPTIGKQLSRELEV